MMGINNLKCLFSGLFLIILVLMVSCCTGKQGGKTVKAPGKSDSVSAVSAPKLVKMVTPDENAGFRLGEQIEVVIERESRDQVPDSIMIFYNGNKVARIESEPWRCRIRSDLNQSTGRKSLKAVAYKDGKPNTTITRFMIILSDKPPKRYSYKVIQTFPHDRNAFTQGLFYDNGTLYEGTGQETGSSLREVELATGKVIRQLTLEPPLFGEGITLYKDRIYQVTWQSRVGFVYDKQTFSLINRIYYQTEGWGLATMDDRIIMSDGTNILYIIDPETFTTVAQLEVYDSEKKVDQLNELEYINGEIWSNIWMTDLIARIDPSSGSVLGYIDLKGILKDPDTDTSVNVLNGIAWDRQGGKIYVTGKNWPRLFEIKVTE